MCVDHPTTATRRGPAEHVQDHGRGARLVGVIVPCEKLVREKGDGKKRGVMRRSFEKVVRRAPGLNPPIPNPQSPIPNQTMDVVSSRSARRKSVTSCPRRCLSKNRRTRCGTSGLRKFPCPAPTTGTNVTSTPAFFKASAKRSDWLKLTAGSFVPWITRNGGSPAETNVMGDALRAASVLGPQGTADQLGLGIVGRHAVAAVERQEIGRPELVDDAADLAADIGVGADRPFQLRNVAAGAEHRDQVAAGRSADHADPVGIDVVLLRVRPKPANRGLAVMDLRRPDNLAAQAIADRRAGILAAGHEAGQSSAIRSACHRPGTHRRG